MAFKIKPLIIFQSCSHNTIIIFKLLAFLSQMVCNFMKSSNIIIITDFIKQTSISISLYIIEVNRYGLICWLQFVNHRTKSTDYILHHSLIITKNLPSEQQMGPLTRHCTYPQYKCLNLHLKMVQLLPVHCNFELKQHRQSVPHFLIVTMMQISAHFLLIGCLPTVVPDAFSVTTKKIIWEQLIINYTIIE